MKAGLITFHYAHHYGAQLQAYALHKTIGDMGVPCEIIDYVRPDTLMGNSLFKKGLSPRSLMSNAHTLLHYPAFKKRYSRFNAFVKEHMRLGEKRYLKFEELMADPPKYDLYVCGSDQIWNPLIFTPKDFDSSFFMPFAGDKKRIAYAPSFGIAKIPDGLQKKLKGYLETFGSLSTRESQGARIVEELTGRTAEVVLDPTLLLKESEWSSLCAKPGNTQPYILCYFVSDPTPFMNAIQIVAKELRLPIICLCGSRRRIPGSRGRIFNAGPKEFLSLFREAAFVMTNSFHGTVFSILFNKDFYSFESSRNDSGKSVNSRLQTILKILGLEDRLIKSGASGALTSEGDIGARIDYAPVLDKLEKERETSLKYLKNALGDQ